MKKEGESVCVTEENLSEFLGRKEIHGKCVFPRQIPASPTGLARTRAGGEILFIETKLTKGKGNLQITGQLGDVMKESVEIALTLVKALYPRETELLSKRDLHIHVPAGRRSQRRSFRRHHSGHPPCPLWSPAGRKSQDCHDRRSFPQRRRSCPLAGCPEKLMALRRAGITKVLIPQENVEDLEDVAEEVKESWKLFPSENVQEALELALLKEEDSAE